MCNKDNQTETLCWKCRHSVPTLKNGCPWSKDGEEVDGWLAIRTPEREEVYGRSRCYMVINCPMFQPDTKGQKMDGSDNAFRSLGLAVVTQCVLDYREYLGQYLDDGEFMEYCIAKRKQYVKIRDWIYGKKQRASRRNDKQMFDFLTDKRNKLKKMYAPYKEYADRGWRAKERIKSCEWFFQTETFVDYSDMDGVRIMHMIQDELKAERKERM